MAGLSPLVHLSSSNAHLAAATAFNPVAARRTLAQPDSIRMQSNPPPTRKVDWPQPVRDYVLRSFQPENLIPGIDRNEMEDKLKKTLSDAAEGSHLDGIDWATLPLPQQLIQQERAMAAWTAQPTNDPIWEPLENHDLGGSRKRKFGDDTDLDNDSTPTPPWRADGKSNGLGDRVTYANQAQASKMEKRVRKQQEALGKGTSKYQAAIEKRKQRFGAQLGDSPPWGHHDDTNVTDVPTGPVIGLSQQLEKNYFRLTSAPKPEEVRPQEVLMKTFNFIKKKWMKEGNYNYICDQFKSMRQDLTVQHIKNEFTVKVYELHARIALEMGDLGEYNQCQTQLRALYSLSVGGNPAEFLAYRILYFIHTCNRVGLNDILAEITTELKQQEPVQHALAVRSAQASGNYHKLLAVLYQSVPNMGAYLMDMFVARERLAALAVICKSYKPNVSIQFLAEELGFDTYEAAVEFLEKNGADTYLIRLTDSDEFKALDTWKLETAKTAALFDNARARAFRTVDIKGQI